MSEYFRKQIKKQHYPLHFSEIKYKTFFNNCILSALQARGYKQAEADDWNIYWCEKQFLTDTLDKMRLFPNKRVNHFRNWYEICRKDLLAKNIKRYKKQLDKEGQYQQASAYDYTPLTYNLPTQYPIFLQEFKRANKAMWIMKPIGKSQGKGIFLFNKISDISDWSQYSTQTEPYIVQRYIHNPLLIGNKKFDMRLYTLVTSHNPLTIYIYRSGFGRFTHMKYEQNDVNALQSHLTNVAIQKNSENYDEERGGKYFIDKLRSYLNSKYSMEKIDKCFYLIQQLIIKTLIATSKLIVNDKKCFELYGYDIMIDENLKPWLIQINGSPSMSANTEEDALLKKGLLDDVFSIVNLQKILTGQEEQVGGFDLVYKDGKRFKANYLDFNNGVNPSILQKREYSMIGCSNNRHQNLRKLARFRAIKLAQQYIRNGNNSQPNTNNSNNSIRGSSISNNTNSQTRGRSVVLNNTGQVKPNQFTNNMKPTIYQGNNNLANKKSPNLQDVLKLPKVVGGNMNTNILNGVKIPETASKKQSEGTIRVASRQSRR